jgi:hypothetical protein
MKKLIIVLAVAGFMAACNNNSESTPAEPQADTAAVAPAQPDSTAMPMDSTAKPADSAAKQ